MGVPVTSVLQYTLWPLLVLSLAGLWFAAAVQIARRRRGGGFTDAKLLGMAAAVSAVAVIALAGAGATLAGGWADAVSVSPDEARTVEGVPTARSYIFSFGLEHAFPATTGAEQQTRHH
jgi:hypothetical protein